MSDIPNSDFVEVDDESGTPIGGAVISDPQHVSTFVHAGNAIITVKSTVSGKHYTFRVRKVDESDKPQRFRTNLYFVGVLSDGDNTGEFTYVGVLDNRGDNLRLTKKSVFKDDSPCVRAFRYFYGHLNTGHIAPSLEVRHEGRCGRCARTLTHPDSLDRGIGPVCAGLMGR